MYCSRLSRGRPLSRLCITRYRQWRNASSSSSSSSATPSLDNPNNNSSSTTILSNDTSSDVKLPEQPFAQLPDVAGLSPPPCDLPPRSWWDSFKSSWSLQEQQKQVQIYEGLFQAALYQSQNPTWYGPGRIPRDFRGRHSVLTMHLWFLHKRLIADPYDKQYGEYIDDELFNVFWDDTTCRIRQAGIMELQVNKNLLQVQQYSYLHLVHYDHCFTLPPQERLLELRKLLAKHVFRDDTLVQTSTDLLDRLAWYVDANYRNIVLEWPDAYYRESAVVWTNLPDFTNLRHADGTLLEHQDIFPEDVLPTPWAKNITRRGLDYYWNTETGQSQWERPKKGNELK